MVTDVVSTGFADSERCLDSHKITTVTLNEIRGARSSHLSSLLWSKGKCSRLTYANRSLNPMQRHWFNFFFFSDLSRYLFFLGTVFSKEFNFSLFASRFIIAKNCWLILFYFLTNCYFWNVIFFHSWFIN